MGMVKNCHNCIYSEKPSYAYPCDVCVTAHGSEPSKWEIGVPIPAVPSPKDDNPNIQELCFHNGEQHMKEKVLSLITEFERKYGAAAKMTTVLLRGEIEKL